MAVGGAQQSERVGEQLGTGAPRARSDVKRAGSVDMLLSWPDIEILFDER